MSAPKMDFERPRGAAATFPRSRDDLSAAYLASYRVDCKDLMRAFVNRVLTDLPAEKAHLAHGMSYQAAKAEIERPLFTPEHRLLSEATRDWMLAHTAKQAVEARR